MRVRADWVLSVIFSLSVVACSSSKSSSGADTSMSGAADETGGKSASKAGNSSSSQGGKSGSNTGGSTSSNNTGTGKAGHSAPQTDEDAGPGSSSGGDNAGHSGGAAGSGTTTNLPADGNQLALCSMAEGDCNKGLACHAPATLFSPGRGFCSKICEEDSDCSGLPPSSAKYTCGTGQGTRSCELTCSGTDDTSCPTDMKCVQTAAAVGGRRAPGGGNAGTGGAGGADGSGGTPAQFRCRYPFETSPAWGPCGDGTHVCDDDLTCTTGRTAHCAQSCEMDSDCSKPGSGSISPTCATLVPERGMTKAVKQCVLDCSSAKDGCPSGTTCVDGPRVNMGMGMGMNTAMPAYQRCE